MNSLLIGWRTTGHDHGNARAVLDAHAERHGSGGGGTTVFTGEGWFVGSVEGQSPQDSPHRYVHDDGAVITTYDGLPVDTPAVTIVTDASAIGAGWERAIEVLEGQFVLVRVERSAGRLSIVTDPLGMKQVYRRRVGSTDWFSTSARLLADVGGDPGLSAEGVSTFLSLGFANRDHTLDAGVHTLPGGTTITADLASSTLRTRTRWGLESVSRLPAGNVEASTVEQLSAELVDLARTMPASGPLVRCSLTGGRDSRVVAAAFIASGRDVEYYTEGERDSDDVQIAEEIARRFGLSHQSIPGEPDLVADAWLDLERRTLAAADGLVSLHQAADLLGVPTVAERHTITIGGVGGEVARNYYADAKFVLGRRGTGMDAARRFLVGRVVSDKRGLLRPETVAVARAEVEHCVDDFARAGFGWLDIPEAYYGFERVRRWAGTQTRKVDAVTDAFLPLCSRPWFEASFRGSCAARWCEQLPHDVIARLVPGLGDVRLEREPWRPRHPLVAAAALTARRQWRRRAPAALRGRERIEAFSRGSWINADGGKIATHLRELALDNADARVWDHVDRDRFEAVSRPGDEHAAARSQFGPSLLAVSTVLEHELGY